MVKKYTPQSPVADLPGVGATRQKQLQKLGIYTIEDLIYLFPRAYEKRGSVRLLSEVDFDRKEAVILTVASSVTNAMIRRGMTISKFKAFDDSGNCEVVFFNSSYVKDIFRVGSVFRFYGKVSLSKGKLQLINPKYEPLIPNGILPPLIPIYPLTEGISSKFIDKITKIAIDETISQIRDPLPDDIRIKYSLPVLSYALKNVHFPESEEALTKALSRLAFDEMFIFGIGIAMSSEKKRAYDGAQFSPCDLSPLTALLPYELTSSQKNAVNDIYKDTVLNKSEGKIPPMTRILIGDVGSGKTICAVMAIYIASNSGYQSALMAPTEILARQHYADVSALFGKLNIRVGLLLGSTPQKEKKMILQGLKSGEIQVIIGTHSLLSDNVDFSNLGLIITDEQHRFGVSQRGVLKDKAKSAHMLVMSATPIPRTLALTMYGDLDISRITEMPKGRKRVDTFVVDESYRDRLNAFISKQVENGGQCYIVCPSIEPVEEDENSFTPNSLNALELVCDSSSKTKNVLEYADKLRQSLPNLNIQFLHGKMKTDEKDAVMRDFSSGRTDVLVSTTVIEVGVNIPNTSLMIIEDAERFGLAQLHQLRGRVGRGERKSYCVLVSGNASEKSRARLEIMRTTYDGFEIAEKDLLLRGPGDFFASISQESIRQSGGFEFKLAKLCNNSELFENAFAAAKLIIESDPELTKDEHRNLHSTVLKSISPLSSTIS